MPSSDGRRGLDMRPSLDDEIHAAWAEVRKAREQVELWKGLAKQRGKDAADAEGQVERLRNIIGELYVQRGQDVNTLRTAIRRAFHEATA